MRSRTCEGSNVGVVSTDVQCGAIQRKSRRGLPRCTRSHARAHTHTHACTRTHAHARKHAHTRTGTRNRVEIKARTQEMANYNDAQTITDKQTNGIQTDSEGVLSPRQALPISTQTIGTPSHLRKINPKSPRENTKQPVRRINTNTRKESEIHTHLHRPTRQVLPHHGAGAATKAVNVFVEAAYVQPAIRSEAG